MIRFIPTSGESVALALSVALWNLSSPSPGPMDTQKVFPSRTCLDGSVWLAVDTSFSIPVHPNAEIGEVIPAILQPWIDEGLIPSDTINDLDRIINLSRGKRLVLWDTFPLLFRQQAKTREELIEAGLLPSL